MGSAEAVSAGRSSVDKCPCSCSVEHCAGLVTEAPAGWEDQAVVSLGKSERKWEVRKQRIYFRFDTYVMFVYKGWRNKEAGGRTRSGPRKVLIFLVS